MNPTPRAQNAQGNQKFVFVTQRPQTPVGTSQSNQPTMASSQNTVVKFVQTPNQTTPKIATGSKIVMVSNQGNQNTGQASTLLISKPPPTQQQQQQQHIQQQFQQLQQQQFQQLQQHQQIISADDLSHLVD